MITRENILINLCFIFTSSRLLSPLLERPCSECRSSSRLWLRNLSLLLLHLRRFPLLELLDRSCRSRLLERRNLSRLLDLKVRSRLEHKNRFLPGDLLRTRVLETFPKSSGLDERRVFNSLKYPNYNRKKPIFLQGKLKK